MITSYKHLSDDDLLEEFLDKFRQYRNMDREPNVDFRHAFRALAAEIRSRKLIEMPECLAKKMKGLK